MGPKMGLKVEGKTVGVIEAAGAPLEIPEDVDGSPKLGLDMEESEVAAGGRDTGGGGAGLLNPPSKSLCLAGGAGVSPGRCWGLGNPSALAFVGDLQASETGEVEESGVKTTEAALGLESEEDSDC